MTALNSRGAAGATRRTRAADRLAIAVLAVLILTAVASALLLLIDRPTRLLTIGPMRARYHGGVLSLSWQRRYAHGPALVFTGTPATRPTYETLIKLRQWDDALPRRRWQRFGVRYVRDYWVTLDRSSSLWVADEVRSVSLRFEYVSIILTGLSFFAYIPVGRMRLRIRRIARGLCPMCAYDLRASPRRCPECGHEPRGY